MDAPSEDVWKKARNRDSLQVLTEVDASLGEAFFLLGVLSRTAPEEFRSAILELRTNRLKAAARAEADALEERDDGNPHE
jgi:ligand-binding SRPBCC domain-containing protein